MIETFITKLEDTPMSVVSWFAAFMGIVWIRYLLEPFSSPDASGFLPSDIPTLIHYTMYYLAAVTLTVVVVSTVTRISALRMMRAVIFILPIMWLAPLIDLMRGVYAKISYVPASTPSALLHDFLTYFGPLTGFGATLGIRIELGILIALIGVYVYVHTKRLPTAILGSFVAYVIIFITFTLPSILSFLLPEGGLLAALQSALVYRSFSFHSELYSVNMLGDFISAAILAQTLYLILCVSGVAWFCRVRGETVRAVFKNVRPERATHFLIMGVLGGLIALAERAPVVWSILDWITIMVALLTILFAWLFAVVINDLADESIDAISNTERPLITGALTRGVMRDTAFIFGLMTLLGSLALGPYSLYLMAVFSAAYYIYSAPPLRLKRIPMLASALIGIATLAIMMFGFFLISPSRELIAFPPPIALLVVLFITLITNVRDLKDIEGDSAAGIWTLPTLLGDRRSRMLIGAMMCLAYALVPLFITIKILWIPSLIAGFASWIGLTRGLGERFTFALYFLYLASVVLLLSFV